MLLDWTGPYGGVPPFDRADPASIEADYGAAIEMFRQDVRAIATNPEPATFNNVIAVLEDARRPLRNIDTLFRTFASTRNDAAMRDVQQRLAPLKAGVDDALAHDPALFARIGTVLAAAQPGTSEHRVTDVIHRRLARAGAGLPQGAKTQLADINARLATLQAQFAQNLLADQERDHVRIENEAQLAGLSPAARTAAADAARTRGLSDGWVITNDRGPVTHVLAAARDRSLRERVWRMWHGRGVTSNPPVVAEILKLRGEKARLLGFANYAAFALDDRMAATPEAAMALMTRVWNAAKSAVATQADDLSALSAADGINGPLAAWDRSYYAEQLRRERYGFDDTALTPYLALDAMLAAAFWTAQRLYGVEFAEVTGLPVTHADVRTFEVRRDNKPLGALWLDPFARPGKVAGGWMDEYRQAEHFREPVMPLASITLNLPPPAKDAPALLSWDAAHVLFHEMGHALHALLTDVAYPSLGIMHVPWDFIELPSQINERWLEIPEVLERFARHHETGESMPPALIADIAAARNFDAAPTLQYVGSAIVDVALHLAADGSAVDAEAIEASVLRDLDMPTDVDVRYRVNCFSHIFSGDLYAAGFYVYLWADTMVADAAEMFEAAPGGMFDRDTADRFRSAVLSAGSGTTAAKIFRNFRGRDPDPEALMRRMGLAGV